MPLKSLLPFFVICMAASIAAHAQTNQLKDTGYVGIGTLTPSEKLTLHNGNLLMRKQFGTGPEYDWFTIGSHEQAEKEVTGVFTGILGTSINPLLDNNGKPTSRNDQPTFAYQQSWALTFGSGEYHNNFSIWGGHHAASGTPLTPFFNIANTGYVGIGTTTPQASLDVNGNIKLKGWLFGETDQQNISIRLKPAAANTNAISGIYEAYDKADVTNSAGALFGITNTTWGAPLPSVALMSTKQGTGVTKDIIMWAHDAPSASNAALCIKANTSNIGIGTINPGNYKLAVEGTLGARKVKVTEQSWADFVFDPAYPLPALEAVESHIREKRHLPGIPSAAEVSQQGLDIGDMQQKQMQKIEELTLYVIDLHKKLAGQQALIDEQAKALEALKKLLGNAAEKQP